MDGRRILTFPNGTSGVIFWWGMWALNPNTDMFAQLPTLYTPMQDLAPEWAWGFFTVTIAMTSLLLAIYNHARYQALLLSVTFTFMSTLYWMADPISAGGIIWGWLGFFNMVCFLATTKWFSNN